MRKILLSMALGALCFTSLAQTFNPSVEVTNDFLTNTQTADRVSFPISVPDSVTHFQLQFDYNIFANPYNGSYKFVPYTVSLEPEARSYDGSKFYLRAGAGYTLHPVVTAAASPRIGKNMILNLYQNFDGYIGPYRAMDSKNIAATPNAAFSGRDVCETFATSLFVDRNRYTLIPAFQYNGIGVKDLWQENWYNSLGGDVRLLSKSSGSEYSSYAFDFAYAYATDGNVDENKWSLAGTFCPYFYLPYRFETDFEIGCVAHSGAFNTVVYNITTSPHFKFRVSNVNLIAGFRADYTDRLYAFPDFRFNTRIFKNSLGFYGGVTGGTRVNSYSYFKQRDHHFSALYAPESFITSTSVEKVNAHMGLSTTILSVVSANLKMGVASVGNDPLYSAAYNTALSLWCPVLVGEDYVYEYIDFALAMNTRAVEIKSDLQYKHAELAADNCFSIPTLKTASSVMFHWRSRIKAGFDLNTCSERTMPLAGVDAVMPAYADLGASFEFKTPSRLAFWARLGNILNQRVELVPFVAEQGINFTAGICLDLK